VGSKDKLGRSCDSMVSKPQTTTRTSASIFSIPKGLVFSCLKVVLAESTSTPSLFARFTIASKTVVR